MRVRCGNAERAVDRTSEALEGTGRKRRDQTGGKKEHAPGAACNQQGALNVTIREYLEQTRESMLYLRERMDDYRMAEMKARNPLKRDLDGMVLSLGDQKAELDQLEQEATAQGKRAYAMINMLDNPRQKNALWSYYAYGLTEAAAMKRGRYRSREEM
jgi:hypothetical protein